MSLLDMALLTRLVVLPERCSRCGSDRRVVDVTVHSGPPSWYCASCGATGRADQTVGRPS